MVVKTVLQKLFCIITSPLLATNNGKIIIVITPIFKTAYQTTRTCLDSK